MYDMRTLNFLLLAHAGQTLFPHDLWTAWTFEPSLLIPLSLTVVVFLWGTWKAWRNAGRGHGISYRNCLSFFGAVLSLVIALVSPLDALSENLFSAHMVQHLVLILISAPLLVMSDFPLAVLWALPRGWANQLGYRLNHYRVITRTWAVISSAVPAWIGFTVALWAWHSKIPYEAALRNQTIHVVEHLVYLATAMLFWWVLFQHTGQKHVRYGMAVLYLFTTAIQSGILGALMTFTTQAWYPYYAPLVSNWGLTPLADQQLAGLIMWIPGGVVFTLLTIGYFAAWLRALEQHSEQARTQETLHSPQELK